MGRERALLVALILVGCDRAPAKESVAATVPVIEPGATGPTKVVVPTEAVPIVEPPAPVETAPAAPAPAPPGATTTGSTDGAAAKPKPRPVTKGAPTETPAPMAPPPIKASPPAEATTARVLVSDKLYRVELAPLAPCTAAAACEAKLVVHALGGYKVNAEYPSKFVAKPAQGVTVEGTGAFAVGSKTVGTMTVTFRAAAAGAVKISGALKLSVCTDEVCEIAAPVVAFDVPVTAP